MRALLASVLVVFAAPAPFAQAPPADLQKAIDAREAALTTGDDQAWGRLTTDDFVVVNPDGLTRTKAQRMTEIKGNKQPPSKILERSFRTYGDVVVETRLESDSQGRTRLTFVWVKQNGQWRAASVHQTRAARTTAPN